MSGPALYALPPDSVAVGGARYALNTGCLLYTSSCV